MPAIASNVRGNGGDVLLGCDNLENNGKILDYFEAESFLGLKIDLGAKEQSPDQIAWNALSRIPDFDKARKDRLQGWAKEFMSDVVFAPGIQLKQINDSNEVSIPKGCRLEQAAVQETPMFPEAKRYLVSKDVWDVMDDENRAGLILHEIIYREALSFGQTDSVRTRYFNALVSSGKIASVAQVDYNTTLASAGFPNACQTYKGTLLCFVYGTVTEPKFGDRKGLLAAPQMLPVWKDRNGNPSFVKFQGFVTMSFSFVSEGTLAEAYQTIEAIAGSNEGRASTIPAGYRVKVWRNLGSFGGMQSLGPDTSL